ncbi:hypothetical protein [Kribbella solani]|uniref:hypothetical protein n=1 Tax=Kribbella solani TaxID=236067 RepID=UPI0029A28F40|nr:hypothetical protein [Kribbella solani]MDX2971785.1 hypothetical protein [Kribbella solani]
MNDPGFAITAEERRRLLEANASAARFFRQELLRAGGWPVQYLKDAGVEQVLAAGSMWRVGYAPDTANGLVDHLRSEGFGSSAMVRAGLAMWVDGELVDRHRDRLMLVARDAQLSAVGFVGVELGGKVQFLSTGMALHQASNVLVGIEEQLDLLRGGATPVLVDDPVDAIAVSEMSRRLEGQWAGIPVVGAGLSTAQARMLRKFTMGDKVVVLLHGDEHRQKLTSGYLLDLAVYYDQVRAVALSCSPRELVSFEAGPRALQELLTTTRPALTYRIGHAAAGVEYEPPDRQLDL